MVQRAEQRRRCVWGAAGTVVVSALAVLLWGRRALFGAAVFGAVATGVQVLAAQLMALSSRPASLDHLTVYVIGVFLRLLGVVLLGVAVSLDRTSFLPWPSALGYLGTILPLLYLETKLGR